MLTLANFIVDHPCFVHAQHTYTHRHHIYKHPETVCFAGINEKRLLHDLLDSYNTLERPVVNESDPLQISFGLTLMQIIDVDEKNQMLVTNIWLKLVSIRVKKMTHIFSLLPTNTNYYLWNFLIAQLCFFSCIFILYHVCLADSSISGMEWYEFKMECIRLWWRKRLANVSNIVCIQASCFSLFLYKFTSWQVNKLFQGYVYF